MHALCAAGPSTSRPRAPAPTTLHAAAACGDLEAVRQLLAAPRAAKWRANPNALNEAAESPIMVAAAHGHAAIIQALVAAGGKVGLRLPTGATAMHLAASNGHAAAIATLAAAGAVVNATTSSSETPLHQAALGGHAAAIQALIGTGKADVMARDGLGMTALHVASGSGSLDAVRALLSAGQVSLAAKDARGWTPLRVAQEAQQHAAAQLLSEAAQRGARVAQVAHRLHSEMGTGGQGGLRCHSTNTLVMALVCLCCMFQPRCIHCTRQEEQ